MLSEIDPSLLGFSADWYKLGIVDDAIVSGHAAAMTRNGESNPLHYRWRAFKSFLARHDSLREETLTALYHLGDAEEDHTLGTSMMTEVLKRRECPDKLLHEATTCQRRHIARFAANRLQW